MVNTVPGNHKGLSLVVALGGCPAPRLILRRKPMLLDLIVVVVTIVSFLVLISFTVGCERL